jgi:hypothetical protein
LKVLNLCLMTLAFPVISNAGTILYPTTSSRAIVSNPLQSASELFKLGLNPASFTLKETKQSLLGKHYYYQQMQDGREVLNAQLIVSVDKKNQILKVFNATQAVAAKSLDSSMPFVSQSMALENLWAKLGAKGELVGSPEVKLVYSSELNLVYSISLSTTAGHYQATVDAHSGNVISMEDATLPRMKTESAPVKLNVRSIHSSFAKAQRAFEAKQEKSFFELTLAAGTAQVFDPNPVVTLGRTDLQDETEASVFSPAYSNQDLPEVTMKNGAYTLSGSKLAIVDFEAPTVAPVTTTDGHWVFERGQSGFTDAMTYLHIDRSIRYLESIGFSGSHAVFPKQIEVDSDGVNGADNSYYLPYAHRLAFGHGCVDDNEDSEVILHELGHAIQHHINSSWSGGDTGAMGEGFGDYWAASYSATREHGLEGNYQWVFKFDGHNDCWPGRKLDSFKPVYNPKNTYSAHSQIDGGVSDEVWSTPLFQAFLEMYRAGVSKSDIDKVIIESHFGLGSGLKMPAMANAIVKTAKSLFPSKNYDQIFLKHFKNQKIL